MANKVPRSGTRPPLHRDREEADRPVPKRTWHHARYGDAPERAAPGVSSGVPQDKIFSEQKDAEATGDARTRKRLRKH